MKQAGKFLLIITGLILMSCAPEKKQEPLGHHANKLTEQQNYSENTDSSYGLDQFIHRNLPPTPETAETFAGNNPEKDPGSRRRRERSFADDGHHHGPQ